MPIVVLLKESPGFRASRHAHPFKIAIHIFFDAVAVAEALIIVLPVAPEFVGIDPARVAVREKHVGRPSVTEVEVPVAAVSPWPDAGVLSVRRITLNVYAVGQNPSSAGEVQTV